jgi:hypothetical protein
MDEGDLHKPPQGKGVQAGPGLSKVTLRAGVAMRMGCIGAVLPDVSRGTFSELQCI